MYCFSHASNLFCDVFESSLIFLRSPSGGHVESVPDMFKEFKKLKCFKINIFCRIENLAME